MTNIKQTLSQIRALANDLEEQKKAEFIRLVDSLDNQLKSSGKLNLEDRIEVGDISGSYNVAIGRHILMEINQIGIPDELLAKIERMLAGFQLDVLSPIPLRIRPFPDIDIVGRADDLNWLVSNPEQDKLLVGHSGAGKTFLLRKLVASEKALFLVENDRGRIAAEINHKKPDIIILDDAHIHPSLLEELQYIRRSSENTFAIVATCWPGGKEKLLQEFPSAKERELAPLSPPEIVDIIRTVGLIGPDALISEIRDQSDGRPGLAVTLTQIVREGKVKDVRLGTILAREISSFIDTWVGPEASAILALFAVGGDGGMPISVVAKALNIDSTKIWIIVTQLGAAGVIEEVQPRRDESILFVHPKVLRYALIRDILFKITLLPFNEILNFTSQAPHIHEAVRTLLKAAQRGANISLQGLLSILNLAPPDVTLTDFAWVREETAGLLLDNTPEDITRYAEPALFYLPNRAIPLLLDLAQNETKPLNSNPNHPIVQWVKTTYPETGIGIFRRKILLDSVSHWLQCGGNPEVGIQALHLVLLPEWEVMSLDPGDENRLHIQYGQLSHEELEELKEMWPQVLELLAELLPNGWSHIRDLLWKWALPIGDHISQETIEKMQKFAHQMIEELVPIVTNQPGPLSNLHFLAQSISADIEVPIDEEYEILCAQFRPSRGWKEQAQQRAERVIELAQQWSTLAPTIVASKLKHFVLQSDLLTQQNSYHSYQHIKLLCNKLADSVENPISWASAILDSDLSWEFLYPFLQSAAQRNMRGWEELAERILNSQKQQQAVIWFALSHPDTSSNLLDEALKRISQYAYLVENLFNRQTVQTSLAQSLLNHDDQAVRKATTIGEWFQNPSDEVRHDLVEIWSQNVISLFDHNEDFLLSQIFASQPQLALDWLRARINDEAPEFWRYHTALEACVQAIDVDTLRGILAELPNDYGCFELRNLLIIYLDDDLNYSDPDTSAG